MSPPQILDTDAEGHNKLDTHTHTYKVKPKFHDCHLLVGCSIGHKPCLLHVSGMSMDQNKNSNKVFFKMVSVTSGISYNTDVCLIVDFSDEFGLN